MHVGQLVRTKCIFQLPYCLDIVLNHTAIAPWHIVCFLVVLPWTLYPKYVFRTPYAYAICTLWKNRSFPQPLHVVVSHVALVRKVAHLTAVLRQRFTNNERCGCDDQASLSKVRYSGRLKAYNNSCLSPVLRVKAHTLSLAAALRSSLTCLHFAAVSWLNTNRLDWEVLGAKVLSGKGASSFVLGVIMDHYRVSKAISPYVSEGRLDMYVHTYSICGVK